MEVAHVAGETRPEPAVQLGGVRKRVEGGDTTGDEAEAARFDFDGSSIDGHGV
jgi:hypothetical protein